MRRALDDEEFEHMSAWPDEAVSLLKDLWAQGQSGALIAERLRKALGRACTRNMVIGKAHRLALPSRETIRRKAYEGAGTRTRAPRAVPWTPEGTSAPDGAGESAQPVSATAKGGKGLLARLRRKRLSPEPPPPEVRKVLEELEARDCRFPLGEPGTTDFAYCGRAALPGQSYCAAHYVLCHRAPGEKWG